jgi:hypothetical protein
MSPTEIKQDLANKTGPFTLTLSDGRVFTIQHTDYILLSPTGEGAAFYPEGGGLTLIDTRQITSIEFGTQKA